MSSIKSYLENRLENQLLVECSRKIINSEQVPQFKSILQNKIDWDYLLETAQHNSIKQLLYWHLNNICPEAVPRAVLDSLKEDFQMIAKKNFIMTSELLRVLNFFNENDICVIPFKGPTLTTLLYGDIPLRKYGDLDILIQRQDITEAERLLYALGYQPNSSESREDEFKFFLFQDDFTIILEMQCEINPKRFSFQFDFKGLWKRLQQTSLNSISTPTLCPEDLILLLCVHGGKHRWERMKWICDIYELIGVFDGKIDWKKTIELARLSGCQRILLLGLHLADEVLGANLPQYMRREIENSPEIEGLSREVYAKLFANLEENSYDQILERLFFQIQLRERWQDRLKILFGTLVFPNERDKKFVSIPFIHILFRIIRLTRKFRPRVRHLILALKILRGSHPRN